MKKLIVIADWAEDSLSCQEFKSAFEGYLTVAEKSDIFFVSSTSSTIHSGFLLYQTVETEERLGRPMNTIIFVKANRYFLSNNTIERDKEAKFAVAKLKSGIFVCGPNTGFCYSMIKNRIDEFFIYQGFNQEGQFSSRDLYSRFCAHLVEEKEDELELEEYFLSEIPVLEDFHVCHIDNFGNIKTNIKESDLKGKFDYGDLIEIEINKIRKKVKYVNNLFVGKSGELVICPGSSGLISDRFLEISIWRYFAKKKSSTSKEEFKNPQIGEKIFLIK